MRKQIFAISILALAFSPLFAANSGTQQRPAQSQQQQSGKIKWYTNFSEAEAAAKKANKPMLLFFTGSDWCGWCKKLHQEVFATPEFAQAVGNDFIFVEVDFPMNKPLPADEQQQNNRLKQKYGITGYPTIILLDSSGNFIAESGYRPGGGKAYADYLQQLMK